MQQFIQMLELKLKLQFKNFDLKNQMINVELIEEYKIYLQYQTGPISNLFPFELNNITDVNKLSSQLYDKIGLILPANYFITISKIKADDLFVYLKIEKKTINKFKILLRLILSIVEIMKSNQLLLKFHLKRYKIFEQPDLIKPFRNFLLIIIQEIDIDYNYLLRNLSSFQQSQSQLFIFKLSFDYAYINEIKVLLSYKLLDFDLNKNILQKLQELMIKQNRFILLLIDTKF
ncbi:unnamed protein product [Paramecium sonneborni]|uniref:Uncharacterized protein n=1 Tax=Paramecium sonneborni TaxID=65129 RepID=A0A8S1KH05_9CILI|nr:unnamed protein product [Paramecium sonneborni]